MRNKITALTLLSALVLAPAFAQAQDYAPPSAPSIPSAGVPQPPTSPIAPNVMAPQGMNSQGSMMMQKGMAPPPPNGNWKPGMAMAPAGQPGSWKPGMPPSGQQAGNGLPGTPPRPSAWAPGSGTGPSGVKPSGFMPAGQGATMGQPGLPPAGNPSGMSQTAPGQ